MTPTRTCVGCRRQDSTDQLVRVVAHDGSIAVDMKRHAHGRGAYLHRNRQCVSAALSRHSLARALRVRGPLDTDALETLAG